MTLKFFALFFIQAVGLSPMAVSLVGALSPLGVSAAALACQPLSKPLGRVQIRWGHEERGLGSAAAGLNGLRQCWRYLCLNGVPCPCNLPLPPACTTSLLLASPPHPLPPLSIHLPHPCSLITRSLDIVLLVLLAFLPTSPPSVRPLLVAVHLARMAVANATRPLMRSGG